MLVRFFCIFMLLMGAFCAFAGTETGGNAPQRTLTHVKGALVATNHVWDGSCLTIEGESGSFSFASGGRKCSVNGVTVWLNASPEGNSEDGSWRMAGVDLDLLDIALLQPVPDKVTPLKILLDAGHGGSDGGALATSGLKEKDLVLSVAELTGEILSSNGFNVVWSRTNDVDVALADRVRKAEGEKVDLFVSIHANKAANRNASGVETYIQPASGFPGTAEGSSTRKWQAGNSNDYANMLLGYSLQKAIAATECQDRGVKRQRFLVLRTIHCPAALVEIGFLSNPTEAKQMNKLSWRKTKAQAIADGIMEYSKRNTSLQAAITKKKAEDEAANERWRQRLAAKKELQVKPPTAEPVEDDGGDDALAGLLQVYPPKKDEVSNEKTKSSN